MDQMPLTADPLDLAIASTEDAIRVAVSDITETENQIAARKRDRDQLGIEIKIMKRAAGLRPVAADGQGADALDREIAGLDATASQTDLAIAALEETLVSKRRGLDTLHVEVRALRRAASLRPIAPPKDIPVSTEIEQPALAANLPPRARGLFGQIRTNDPRLPVLPGG